MRWLRVVAGRDGVLGSTAAERGIERDENILGLRLGINKKRL